VWLDQCELSTIEVQSSDWMVLGNELAIHIPIGGIPTTTWRSVGTGYKNIRAQRRELVEPLLAATYDMCPDFVTTFGAAMGWVVLLEAAATIMFLGLLMPFGIVKNDKAPFKAIISQVLNEGLGGEEGDKNSFKATSKNAFNTVVEMQEAM